MNDKVIKWLNKNFKNNIEGKNIVITGANSGIGFEVARMCLYEKANLIMAIRNQERGQKAKDELLKEFPDANIKMMKLDLSSFESIDEFAKELIESKIDVDFFYNNAGVFRIKDKKTKDGYELVMGTNYIGTYYLSSKLMDYFTSLKHEVRVIYTGSIASNFYKLNYDDFFNNKKNNSFRIYCNSKRAVTHLYLFNKEKYKDSNVKVLLVHPGITYTPLIKKAFGKVIGALANVVMKIIFHRTWKAALSTMYLLNDNINESIYVGPRGLYNISGYPKINKLKKKVCKDYNKTIEFTEDLLNKH